MDSNLTRRSLLGAGLALALVGNRAIAQVMPPYFTLKTTEGRDVRIYQWLAAKKRRGAILFSHGASSAPWKYAPLVESWTAAGYDVFAPLHVDSTDHPDTKSFPGFASWKARVEDVNLLAETIPGKSYIAAGHSYGALVALTLGGAVPTRPPGYAGPMNDARVKLVLAYSPPGAIPGLIDAAGFAALAVPALIQTGDKDIPLGSGDEGWKQHLEAYRAAKAGGNRYALTLDGVDHYFGGLICRPELPGPKQSAQMQEAIQTSLLFIDGHGRGAKAGLRKLKARLSQAGPARLESK